jgi:hypothetical protein
VGCFNVACSISNISIDGGDPIVFIPLLPNACQVNENGEHVLNPGTQITGIDDLFIPFCLPIQGFYNEYGSLERIIEDENTKAIESFFGITIKEFVDCAVCMRDETDRYGDIFKSYALDTSYFSHLDDAFFTAFGFEKSADYYYLSNFPFKVRFHEIENPSFRKYHFTITNNDDEVVVDYEGQDREEEIQKAFFRLTGHYINYAEKDQEKINLLKQMSGMFIHGDMFAKLTEIPDKNLLQAYEKFQAEVERYKNIDNEFAVMGMLSKELVEKTFNPWGEYHGGPFTAYFRDWKYFSNIYQEPLNQGHLRDEFASYMSFYHLMYSGNRFFFPNMKGEQSGNNKVSKMILKKSLEIVNKRK